jgi:catecholate siderophore receptor
MRTRLPTVSPLAAALMALLSAPVWADDGIAAVSAPAGAEAAADPQREPIDLDAVQVEAHRVRKASSPRYTAELLDTPQTITVVDKATMDAQGLMSVKDVLGTLPGITFGAGEGGGGYGDKINLRGFDASSDITVDGVRDSGLYTRSDTFNLEALELINGANSAYSGAGSVGGNINLVSKMAREGDAHIFTVGAGTDRYERVTADSNFDLDGGVALRLNAMGHSEDVPGRDEEFRHRWGFAPSIAFGLGSDTRFTLNYLHQEDNNLPQYGVPYALNEFHNGPLPGVDRETYFGYRNTSRQEVELDTLTGIFEHDFSDRLSLRSLGRLQKVEQYTNASALQGTWCLFDGTNPFTGGPCESVQTDADGESFTVVIPPGTWSPTGGPRGNVRDTENFIAYSQTDLTASFDTGAISHQLVAGVSFSKEDYDLRGLQAFRNADGSALPNNNAWYPLQDLDDPYNVWTGPVNETLTSRSKASVNNQAAYVFDTITFNPQWLLNLGARYEHNEGANVAYLVEDGAIVGQDGETLRNEDDLFSYRAGLVYKPVENASVYLAYSNSSTPSKASVNASCTEATCNVDPEEARNIELGTKWDVLGERLSLTAAIFRNERTNYRLPDPDPANVSGVQVLDGRSRVDGVALGAAGRLADHWSIFANYTFLDSEVLQSVSNFCLDNPGAEGCGNSVEDPDPAKGNALPNAPRHSASLWTAYELGAWTFGYGATYQGAFHPHADNAESDIETPSYVVHNAMVGYQINDRIGLQLNLKNLADKEYYHSIRNTATSGWAIPGDGRSATLTATFRF